MSVDVTKRDNAWSLAHWMPTWHEIGTLSVGVENWLNAVNDIAPAFGTCFLQVKLYSKR
jgi:hypothetical protein